jgi:hypothetical protein
MIAFAEKRYNKQEAESIVESLELELPEKAKIELAKMIRREPKIANSLTELDITELAAGRRKQKILKAIEVGKQVGEKARTEAAAERLRIRNIPNHAERLQAIRDYKPPQHHELHHHYAGVDHEVMDIAHGAFQNAMEDLGHMNDMHEHDHHHAGQGRSEQMWANSVDMAFCGAVKAKS